MITIAGVLLAAGASARMGGPNKLLLPVRGEPLVRWPAEALWDGGLGPLVAVVGRDASAVREALRGLPYRIEENPAFQEGMAGSLRAGVGALDESVDAVAVALGDLPNLRPQVVRFLAFLFRESPQGIVVPVYEGRRGHPVILDLKRYRRELLALTGDEGARSILARHPDDVLEVPVYDPGVITDVDTRDAYEALGRNR
ncbi:nucleotidyltransferase family protein [Deferrisoma palaeochoriense]